MQKVSVALATYNGARFLREQLSSLIGQTLPPAELVVSDDGSSDGTLAIVHEFAKVAPFDVTMLPNTGRLGFSDNFLNAAEHCRHDLIAFCDQDDIWLPGKLETSVARLRDDDSLLTMHRLTITDESLNPSRSLVQDIVADRVYQPLELDPYMTGWGNSMLFRRELTTIVARERRPKQSDEEDRPLSHDTWIYMLAAALGRVSHIMSPLLLYRQHGANTMGLGSAKRWPRLREMTKVQLPKYREQASINATMATLFDEVARRPGPFAAAAADAAVRYRQRHALAAARAAIYDGESMAARFGAFRTSQRLVGEDRPWIGSMAKELALGVTGLNRRSRASKVGPDGD